MGSNTEDSFRHTKIVKNLNSDSSSLLMAHTRKSEPRGSVPEKSLKKLAFNKPNPEILETFRNRYPNRDYIVNIKIHEFTCLCPLTDQPDFATIYVTYIPDQKCIESKSLKLYIFSFRNFGVFHEDCVNRILDDCVGASEPRWMQVAGKFSARGGISLTPIVEYAKLGFALSSHFEGLNSWQKRY
jgi:7-cyano-7-deazaguanine reductase